MRKLSPSVPALQHQYDRLRQSLARIGLISHGSVLQRSALSSGRSGFQWTRKVAQKTVTVALSRDQFAAMRQAVSNQRKLRKTLQQMESVSRQIIFASAPDTQRRKPLSRKVLGTI
jgi:Family of unknown function (DUF6788)